MIHVWTARPLLSTQPNIRGEATRRRNLGAFVLTRPTAPHSSPWLLCRDSSSGLLNPRLLTLQPPVCPASCNLSLFIYPPGENNANQPLPTPALLPGNPQQVSIPLRDFFFFLKREKKQKRGRMLHADVLFDISAKTQSCQQASSSCFAPNTCFTHVYMFTAVLAQLDPVQCTLLLGLGRFPAAGKREPFVPQKEIQREASEELRRHLGGDFSPWRWQRNHKSPGTEIED